MIVIDCSGSNWYIKYQSPSSITSLSFHSCVTKKNFPSSIYLNPTSAHLFYESPQYESLRLKLVDMFKKLREEICRLCHLNKYKSFQCILVIPIAFNDYQIKLMKKSCKEAEFHIVDVIIEPLASLFNYISQDKISYNSKTLICNIGKSKFDITLLSTNFTDKNITIYGYKTDYSIGGDNITYSICNYCINKYKLSTGVIHPKTGVLFHQCEVAKININNNNIGYVDIPTERNEIKEYKIDRKLLNELNRDLLSRINSVVIELLKELFVDINEIDYIILIGGCTKMYFIKELFATVFSHCEILDNQPQYTVVEGAMKYYKDFKNIWSCLNCIDDL